MITFVNLISKRRFKSNEEARKEIMEAATKYDLDKLLQEVMTVAGL